MALGGVVATALQGNDVRNVGCWVHTTILQGEEAGASLVSHQRLQFQSSQLRIKLRSYPLHLLRARVGLELKEDSVCDAHPRGNKPRAFDPENIQHPTKYSSIIDINA